MQDNIVDFRSRKPLDEVVKDAEQAVTDRAAAIQDHKEKAKSGHLAELDKIRELVADGTLEGFILVARSPRNVFLTEVAMPGAASPTELLSYVGALECIKLELVDKCQMLPQMVNDGSIVATQEIAETLL